MNIVQHLISSAVNEDDPGSRDALRNLVDRGTGITADVLTALRNRPPVEADRLIPVVLRWPAEETVRHLAPLLEESTPHVAVRAARILGRTHHRDAVAPLACMLNHPLQDAATAALGVNGSVEGIGPLQELLMHLRADATDFGVVDQRSPSSAELIASVIRSLGRLGDDTHAEWLNEILLKAEDPSGREAAAVALRDVPVAGALESLASALTDSVSNVRRATLDTLWSYRTIQAIDVIMHAQLNDLAYEAKALLYDVVALDVSGSLADWRISWSHRRGELPPHTCLLGSEPINIDALIELIQASSYTDQALSDLELFYGLRVHWDPRLDEPAALIEELKDWSRRCAPQFVPGKMYRFGREVPEYRLPRRS